MNDETDGCPGTNRNGEPCGHPEGWGTDFDEGACKFHRGTSPDGSSHEANGHAETHGLRSDSDKWFERHRDEVGDDVRRMVRGWMRDAPFGWDNYGNVQLLVDAAINECQVRRGDAYIDDHGIVVESFDGIAKDGREIRTRKENPALQPKSRLQRDTVRILEKLGVLDDPETQSAAARHEVADALREALDS